MSGFEDALLEIAEVEDGPAAAAICRALAKEALDEGDQAVELLRLARRRIPERGMVNFSLCDRIDRYFNEGGAS